MSETTATIPSLSLGTGHSIYKTTLLPAIQSAQHSVILITCFWSRSRTLDALNETLLKLSSSALQRGDGKKITVHIGFSSSSLFQKLFHTSSAAGQVYPPEVWTRKLGLLGEEDLGGLEVRVKSVFLWPFSVWHPKFVIIDQTRVFLPSCNVSWEDWFEGCVEMRGPIVEDFVKFWRQKWSGGEGELGGSAGDLSSVDEGIPVQGDAAVRLNDVPCKFLPSAHHRNPNFRLPWLQCAPPPATTLNLELLRLFTDARKEIFLQTPNVTSPPVLNVLLDALKRGVDVRITTSERLMILEQLVTAGTTTARCVRWLIKRHQRLSKRGPDEEAGLIKPGRLHISYYQPKVVTKSSITGGAEPVQSHLKLAVVDRHAIVFGSGNMDRASWYTSQELGVGFYSNELVAKTLEKLEAALEGRRKLLYDSEGK
ncbi:hypothetical protein M409DRAFT_19607 [Zasmidium cellare ATCC 36951]|uniref:PLD phosphodiesterase domain-containing protein n=1 Tax=Zasmidium cellare ATCC 36951 TaxID=1080233 RepID=A0A6A6CW00_ZASCE|nr:uncharacterized protein M409DRAFT_19607 [Zasmidium cellare ATCC 36951]KAF2169992.1 hypothetical protein M409DRAFT_19607 [Zasmidium cellare ATCC 36951]